MLVRRTNSASAERSKVNRALSATYMVRDMITTTSEDFGPAQFEQATKTLASMHEASTTSIVGDELLENGYAQVHVFEDTRTSRFSRASSSGFSSHQSN